MIPPCCTLFPSLFEPTVPAGEGPTPDSAGTAGPRPAEHGGLTVWPGPEPHDLGPTECALAASSPRDDVVVVRAIGEIDLASGPALQRALSAAVRVLARRPGAATGTRAVDAPRLVCDLSTVTFFGASGLSALLAAADHAEAAGVDLRAAGAQHCVRLPLEVTGVGRQLHLYDTLTAATSGPPDRDVSWRT